MIKKIGIHEEFYVHKDGEWVRITEEEFNDLLYPKSAKEEPIMTDIEKVFYVFDRYEEMLEHIIAGLKKEGDGVSNIEHELKTIRHLRNIINAHIKLDI